MGFDAGQWVRLVEDIAFHPSNVPVVPAGTVGQVIRLVEGTENEDVYIAEYRYCVKFEIQDVDRQFFQVQAYRLEPISLLEAIAKVAQ